MPPSNMIPLPGYEKFYLINKEGQIWSLRENRFRTPRPSEWGYKFLSLWDGNKAETGYVHVLVARTFLPNPENKPEVNHLDGNKLNNSLENLEWVTTSENRLHAYRTGLAFRRKGPTYYQARKIYRISNGECVEYRSLSDAAREFKVTTSALWLAINKLTKYGERQKCKGYYWSYQKLESLEGK